VLAPHIRQARLLPHTAERLTPAEILGLSLGEQERYERLAELVAWATFLICISIPRFSKGSDWRSEIRGVQQLLKHYPPPNYRVKKDKRRGR
jgi:hypothetical protein